VRTTTRRQAPTAHIKRVLLSRHHIVAPSLCVADAAAASVFGAARSRGPIARDVIAKVTHLSIATVNRQVTAPLTLASYERADLAVSGRSVVVVPVEVNHEPFLTLASTSARGPPASWPPTCSVAPSTSSRPRRRGGSRRPPSRRSRAARVAT
jgi:hypothetical protein